MPQGALPQGTTGGDEAAIYRQAGFDGPHHVEVPRGEIVDRSIDQIIAATFSLSSSTPHLFGTQRSSFENQLKTLLTDASDHGQFSERARDLAFDIWRPTARPHVATQLPRPGSGAVTARDAAVRCGRPRCREYADIEHANLPT